MGGQDGGPGVVRGAEVSPRGTERRHVPGEPCPARSARGCAGVYLYDLLFAALRGSCLRLRLDERTADDPLRHAMVLAPHNRDLPAYQADPARTCLGASTEHHLERVVYGLVHMLSMDDSFPGGLARMARDGTRPIVLAVVNEGITALGRSYQARREAWRREDETRGKAGDVYSREERARLRAERGDVWGPEGAVLLLLTWHQRRAGQR